MNFEEREFKYIYNEDQWKSKPSDFAETPL